jgi:hypothetical protein
MRSLLVAAGAVVVLAAGLPAGAAARLWTEAPSPATPASTVQDSPPAAPVSKPVMLSTAGANDSQPTRAPVDCRSVPTNSTGSPSWSDAMNASTSAAGASAGAASAESTDAATTPSATDRRSCSAKQLDLDRQAGKATPSQARPSSASYTMSGTIRNQSGAGLSAIWVDVFDGYGNYYDSARSGAGGQWSMAAGPGNYFLEFSDDSNTYGRGWYTNAYMPVDWAPTADQGFITDGYYASRLFVVSAGLSGIDIALPLVTHISGTLSDAGSHAGLGGILVDIYSIFGFYYARTTSTGGGGYSIAVAPSKYHEWYGDPTQVHAAVWYRDSGVTYDWTNWSTINAQSDVTGVDAALPLALHISGTVSDGSSHGLPGIEVDICIGAYWGCIRTDTDATGAYSLAVAPNPYGVHFWDPGRTRAPGWYSTGGLTGDAALAGNVTITTTGQTGIDAQLPIATSLAGKVTMGPLEPAEFVEVDAYVNGSFYDYAMTDATGDYSLPVVPGTYDVHFSDPLGFLAGGWYSESGLVYERSTSDHLEVGSSGLAGIDIVLPAAARITGTVTGGDGPPLQGICVGAFEQSPGTNWAWTYTAADGSYQLVVPPGGYKLMFNEPGVCPQLEIGWISSLSGYYYGAGYYTAGGLVDIGGSDAGDVVQVLDAADTTGIDAALPTVPGRPRNVTATPTVGGVIVSWTAPASDNGRPVTGYRVTGTVGSSCSTTGAMSCKVAWMVGASQTFAVQAQNAIGDGLPASSAPVRQDQIPATYHALPPSRIVDTRIELGSWALGSRSKATYMVAGHGGVPPTAIAVTGNVTIVGQTGGGYVSMAPSLTNGVQPSTSTINFPSGDIRANGVTIPLTAAGTIDAMYWTSSWSDRTELIFDVTGYFSADSGARFHAVQPGRVLDSRIPLGAGVFHSRTKQTFTVAGLAGVPSEAVAVTGNVTVVDQTAGGYVSLSPFLTPGVQPTTSTINLPGGDIRANGVTIPLSAGGTLDAEYWTGSTSDTAQVIFDVTGYFANDSTGAGYLVVIPSRVLDSRVPLGAGTFHSRTKQAFAVSGLAGIPSSAVAVTGNVTVVGQTAGGYVSVSPFLTPGVQPSTSTINYPTDDIRANGITVPLGDGGKLDAECWTSGWSDTVNVIFDVTGYFVPAS